MSGSGGAHFKGPFTGMAINAIKLFGLTHHEAAAELSILADLSLEASAAMLPLSD